jgi:hypothetical protein
MYDFLLVCCHVILSKEMQVHFICQYIIPIMMKQEQSSDRISMSGQLVSTAEFFQKIMIDQVMIYEASQNMDSQRSGVSA